MWRRSLFLVATLHLTPLRRPRRDASRIRIPPPPSPLPRTPSWVYAQQRGVQRKEKKKKGGGGWQMDTAHLKRVSAGFIIADHRAA